MQRACENRLVALSQVILELMQGEMISFETSVKMVES